MKARLCAVYNRKLSKFCNFFDKSWLGKNLKLLAQQQGYLDEIDFAMDLAASLAFANVFLTIPNPAVGCVLISKDGKLLSASAHRKKGGFHAERRALLLAKRLYGAKALKGSTLVCTLEPCSKTGATPPCSQIIIESGCAKVIYAATDQTQSGASVLKDAGCELVQINHEPSNALAEQFFAKNFALFKLALRADASINGQISQKQLQLYTHEMRSKIPTLVCFGNTIRTDLPRLDARLSLSQKAPNLIIFSTKDIKALAPEAPCWNVSNRTIKILNYSAQALKQAGCVLIEGGKNALNLVSAECDWLLLHFDANLKEAEVFKIAMNLKSNYAFLPNSQVLAIGRSQSGQFYGYFRINH